MKRRDFITATLVASVGAVTFQTEMFVQPGLRWQPEVGDIIMVVGSGSYRFDGEIWVSLDGMPNMRFID